MRVQSRLVGVDDVVTVVVCTTAINEAQHNHHDAFEKVFVDVVYRGWERSQDVVRYIHNVLGKWSLTLMIVCRP